MTTPTSVPQTGFVLSDKWYSFLKWLLTIVVPAFITLYTTLAISLEWSNTDKIVGIIAAVATFLGVILGISTASYNKSDARFGGVIEVATDDKGTKNFNMVFDGQDPYDIEFLPEITFKVKSDANGSPPVAS